MVLSAEQFAKKVLDNICSITRNIRWHIICGHFLFIICASKATLDFQRAGPKVTEAR